MKHKILIGVLCMLFGGSTGAALAVVNPLPLTDQDCLKCHLAEAEAVAGQESAHKNDIGCLDCHESHPPEGKVVIPQCSSCHDSTDNPHFGLQNCTGCHQPHAPLVTDFSALGGNGRPACITCHDDIDKQLVDHPSAHSEQDCTDCHQQHGLAEGQYQTCVDCHDKHSEDMVVKDCLTCHQPHQPTTYAWSDDINTEFCAACHEELVQNFADNGAAHAENLSCTECHGAHPPMEENVIPS
jgi:predicted CXXCH cytochrome family protein